MGRGDGLRLWPQETLEGIGVVTDAGVLVATTHRLVLPVGRRGGGIENTHEQTEMEGTYGWMGCGGKGLLTLINTLAVCCSSYTFPKSG